MSLDLYGQLPHLAVSYPSNGVLHIEMNRERKLNAINDDLFMSIKKAFEIATHDSNVRAVVFSGRGKMFTSGLDLGATGVIDVPGIDEARKAMYLRHTIIRWQESVSSLENCQKPVIVSIHGAAIGAGIDFATAGDIRICSKETIFSIREVNIGLAADVGTLQRISKVVGNESLIRDWAFTGRDFDVKEALLAGLVSKAYETPKETIDGAIELASLIASKSPVAVQGTKHILNYSRDHSVEDGLRYVATWNSGMLQTQDISTAVIATMNKTKPKFSKL